MTEVLASQTHSTPATEMHWQGGGGCRVMVWENYPPPQRGQIIEKHHTVIARLCNGVAHFVALVRIYTRLVNLV